MKEQVKILKYIVTEYRDKIENDINEFIADKIVISISTDTTRLSHDYYQYLVLIRYKA